MQSRKGDRADFSAVQPPAYSTTGLVRWCRGQPFAHWRGNKRCAFGMRLSARSMRPSSGGLRSSSATLMASTHSVRQDDKVFVGVKRLARPKQRPGKGRRQQASARTGRAMRNHHRFAGRFADRGEAQPQLGDDFASVKLKVLGKPAARLRGWITWRHRTEGQS